MLSISAFRSLSLSSFVPTQAIRGMAVKAAAASAASSKTGKATKDTKAATKTTTKTATKATKTTTKKAGKEAAKKPTKAKKADSKPKPKPKVKAIDLPKRPGTAWTLFYLEHLDKVKAAGERVIPVYETKKASVVWKQLSDSEKQKYEERRQVEVENYRKLMEQRLQEITPDEYKLENSRRQALRAAGKKSLPSLKDPNAPKRPLSSYFLFARDQRETGKYDSLPVREQAKAFAEAWATVSESEKAQYSEKANAALATYRAEKAAYEAKKQ
ncbi:exp1-like protein [Haplosporangium sp. Z 27]|nr:exp1-like protein [Haplosporangium sp. Z 27]